MEGWQGFEYAEVVHKIAAYLVNKPNQTDVLGNMRDDYVSDLAIEALLASKAYQAKHGQCQRAEAQYVRKSLWNYARDQKRLRYRRNRFFFQTPDYLQDPIDLDAQCDARAMIAKVQKHTDRESLEVLALLALAGGEVTEAWRAYGRYHRGYFYAVVRRAREAGKRSFQN
jgi:hypothetical protein